MNPETHRRGQEAAPAPMSGLRLNTLRRTTALALLGVGVIYLFQFLLVWFVRGAVVLPLLIAALVTLVGVAGILRRWRWAPACALIALVGGATAVIQNTQGREQPSSRWLSPFLSGVLGLVLGMLLLAGIVSANPPSTAASTTNGMPTVHIAGSNFLTNVVLVPKGESLVLVDDDSVEHIIQIGTWTPSGLPHPQTEPGAPIVHSLDLKGGSLHIGPFTTAGVFHLYCTIHQGMSLTVVVQ